MCVHDLRLRCALRQFRPLYGNPPIAIRIEEHVFRFELTTGNPTIKRIQIRSIRQGRKCKISRDRTLIFEQMRVEYETHAIAMMLKKARSHGGASDSYIGWRTHAHDG